MQTWRWTELLQMVEMTTGSHSHIGSQAFEVRHRAGDYFDVFSWQLFPVGLQADFQLISRLRLRLERMVLFRYSAPDVIVQWVETWKVWGHTFFSKFSMGKVCWHDVRTVRNRVVVVETNNFIIFRNISTELSGKMHVSLFNGCVKFHAVNCIH